MKMLVPTSGAASARETADYVMQVAQAMNADLSVLHVIKPGHASEAGELPLETFKNAAEAAEIKVECFLREGAVIHQIIDFAEENNIDLIVMGASNGVIVDQWVSSDVCGNTNIPVLVIPYQVFE
jgi:nucleotide-binding universal stress UspA family protein